jgi:hypothetical protein
VTATAAPPSPITTTYAPAPPTRPPTTYATAPSAEARAPRREASGQRAGGDGDGSRHGGAVASDIATGSLAAPAGAARGSLGSAGAIAPMLPAQSVPPHAVTTPVVPTGGTTITIGIAPPPLPVVPIEQYQPSAGILTAASVADVDRRENYLEYLSRHPGEAELFALDMRRRVRVRVVDAQGRPVNDARLTFTGDGLQYVAHTHADGWFDFYPSVTAPQFAGNATVQAQVEGVAVQGTVFLPAHGDGQGPVVLRLPAVVEPPPPALDLGFLIDVTGSMGDELRYVNREIANIVHRIEAEAPGVRVRVGATFYRDRTDDVVVQQIPFTTNVAGFAAVMQNVLASGGGDYPEDLNAGLEAAMTRMAWSDGPAVRVLVLIADAPPQMYPDAQYTYRQAMSDASRRGIRILPVAASGADRTVEYLFRAMGAFTSTPYVYLTDDSGVGAPHMEADTDRVGVERFNDLLTRLVVSDLRGQGMHEPGPLGPQG